MTPGISVIICCYNSANRIIPTLEHLAAQNIGDNFHWEIILIDNCCTDNTTAIAHETWKRLSGPVPLTIMKEKTPGLSAARRCGIMGAKFSTICFCDDDNWLHQNYLAHAYRLMEAVHDIGILAGKGIAVSDIEIPSWFNELQVNYACGPQGDHSGDITERKWAWGAGMILRNEYMRKLYSAGFHHINEDRKGNSLSSGGDSEICFWHVITGMKIWYDEHLVYKHFIPAERLTKEYAQRLMKEHERSYDALYPYYPLLYNTGYKNENKLLLFIKALTNLLMRKEASQYLVHISPLLNSRLDRKTREIIKSTRKFKKMAHEHHLNREKNN